MYNKTVLKNGTRAISHRMRDRESVSVGFCVSVGGRYESDRLKGAAHFLEHLMFKGSRKYKCEEIKMRVEGVGGTLNAFTSEEQTFYYAKVPSRHVTRAVDVLADMIVNPLLNRRDIAKESMVILEEIKMYRDLPQYYVMELLDQLMWGDHPLGKSLAGTAESVSAMTRRDLKGFHQGHYVPQGIIAAACGDIDHKAFIAMLRSRLPKQPAAGIAPTFEPVTAEGRGARARFFHKETEQTHVALGVPSFEREHPDKYVLNLLHIILGGNMSSRLFDELREKRGLAYSVATGIKTLKDSGMFLVRAGVDNGKVTGAVELILRELRKIKRRGVGKDELTRAKDYYTGQLLLGLEDSMDHLLWMTDAVLSLDRFRSRDEIVRRIRKVSLSDIQRVAAEIFDEKRYLLSVVGPMAPRKERDLSKLLKTAR